MKMYLMLFIAMLSVLSLMAQFVKREQKEHYNDSIQQAFESSNKEKHSLLTKKYLIFSLIGGGDAAMRKGNFSEAEEQYSLASLYTDILVTEKVNPRYLFSGSVFDAYARYANLYIVTNNLNKAEAILLEAQRKMNNYLPEKSIFKASVLIKLGEVYSSKGDPGMGDFYFKKAEFVINRNLNSVYTVADLIRSIQFKRFDLAFSQGNVKDARKAIKKMSTGGFDMIFDASKNQQIPLVFIARAKYNMMIQKYEESEYYLNRAKVFANVLDDQVILIQVLKTEFLLQWSRGDIDQAYSLFEELSKKYQIYIKENFASMSEPDRENFYSVLSQDYELFNSFVMSDLVDDRFDAFAPLVYNNQLFSKALLLNQINKVKRKILSSQDTQLIQLLQEWELKKSELSALYFNKKRDMAQIENLKSTINNLERELNDKSNLNSGVDNPIDWNTIAQSLSSNEAAIEIVRVREFELNNVKKPVYKFSDSISYLVLIVRHGSKVPEILKIRNGNELEDKYYKFYTNSIKFRETDTLSYSKFWLPIIKSLPGIDRVFISSDGVFNQINLNSLYNPRTGKFVLDETELVLLTNTKDMLSNKSSARNNSSEMFGRPDYDKVTGMPDVAVNQPQSMLISRAIGNESMDEFKNQAFSDLPGTEEEIKALEGLMLKNSVKANVYLGQKASETQVKQIENPYVLHIATHGFFLKEKSYDKINAMVRSGLVMAGVNNPSTISNDDGILTAYEATNLSLDSTYLVVLSACDTGLGEIKNGEGVYGLQRGFIVAGTRYLLMSLWKVDDQATQLLMSRFYENWLSGDEIHLALRNAQIRLRTEYHSPYYWGAFILLGK